MKDNSKARRIVEDEVEEVEETDSVSQVEPMGDLIADLKKFIQTENKKTSRGLAEEIRRTNDERMNALETSLSFALETSETLAKRLTEVETRADRAEKELLKCTKRMHDMEEQLDDMQQRNLEKWLVFSGPAILRRANAGTSEDPARILYSMLRHYMDFTLNMEQVEEIRREQRQIRVRFNAVDAGSDRHFLIRNKTRLRGSGLYIRECLTPFRHGIYQDLMQLKRTNQISTVFTRDGISFVVVDQHDRPRPIRSLAALERLTRTLAETESCSQTRTAGSELPRGGSAEVDAHPDRDGTVRAAESDQQSQRQVAPSGARQTDTLDAVSPMQVRCNSDIYSGAGSSRATSGDGGRCPDPGSSADGRLSAEQRRDGPRLATEQQPTGLLSVAERPPTGAGMAAGRPRPPQRSQRRPGAEERPTEERPAEAPSAAEQRSTGRRPAVEQRRDWSTDGRRHELSWAPESGVRRRFGQDIRQFGSVTAKHSKCD